MYSTVYILVKATIQTKHHSVQEALKEIQQQSVCKMTDTSKTKFRELRLLDSKLV